MRLQVVIAASVLAVILIGLSTDVDGQSTRGVRRRNRFGRIGRSRSRTRLRSGGGRGGRGGSSSCGENQRRKRGGRCVPKSQDPKGVPAKKGSNGPLPGAPNLNEITSIVTRWLDENAERIPNMVQLVFHSCVGGCDGCINTNSPSNKGLIGSYREVQALWKNEAKQGISLADFVVLLGTKAVEHGMRRNGGPGPRTVEFTTGRTSCSDPTNYLKVFNFPQGQNTDAIEFLMSHFGIPSRGLAVALMGAHSLGVCRTENTGFEGRWDNTPLTLDHSYYRSMLGTTWSITDAPGNEFTQWSANDGRMMLNADLHLQRDFAVNSRPSCGPISERCQENGNDVNFVRQFANNQQDWAAQFIRAFLIMVSKR